MQAQRLWSCSCYCHRGWLVKLMTVWTVCGTFGWAQCLSFVWLSLSCQFIRCLTPIWLLCGKIKQLWNTVIPHYWMCHSKSCLWSLSTLLLPPTPLRGNCLLAHLLEQLDKVIKYWCCCQKLMHCPIGWKHKFIKEHSFKLCLLFDADSLILSNILFREEMWLVVTSPTYLFRFQSAFTSHSSICSRTQHLLLAVICKTKYRACMSTRVQWDSLDNFSALPEQQQTSTRSQLSADRGISQIHTRV